METNDDGEWYHREYVERVEEERDDYRQKYIDARTHVSVLEGRIDRIVGLTKAVRAGKGGELTATKDMNISQWLKECGTFQEQGDEKDNG